MSTRSFALRVLALVAVMFFPVASVKAAELSVREAAVATSVENKEPKGAGTTFPDDVERLYAFTWIEGAEDKTSVRHVWYYGDRKMAEMTLDVGPKSWRTWSNKRILPEWSGEWRVEIVSAGGDVIKKLGFTIEPVDNSK